MMKTIKGNPIFDFQLIEIPIFRCQQLKEISFLWKNDCFTLFENKYSTYLFNPRSFVVSVENVRMCPDNGIWAGMCLLIDGWYLRTMNSWKVNF